LRRARRRNRPRGPAIAAGEHVDPGLGRNSGQRAQREVISNSLTLQYDRVVYLLEPTELAKGLRRNRVRVHGYPDGSVAIKYQGREVKSCCLRVRVVRRIPTEIISAGDSDVG